MKEDKLITDIRKKMMKGECETIRKLFLNTAQRNLLYRMSYSDGMCCADLASEEGITLPLANSRLKTLYNKGYLWRTSVGDPTGGLMFLYMPSKLVMAADFGSDVL